MEDRIPTIFVLGINITLRIELVPEVAAVADVPVPAPVLALAVDAPVAVKKIPTETIKKKNQSHNTCISRTNPRAENQLWDKLLYDQPGEAIVKAFRICVNCKGCAEMHFNRYTSHRRRRKSDTVRQQLDCRHLKHFPDLQKQKQASPACFPVDGN